MCNVSQISYFLRHLLFHLVNLLLAFPTLIRPYKKTHNPVIIISYLPTLGKSNTILLTYTPAIRPHSTCGFSQPHRSGPSWLLLFLHLLSPSPCSPLPAPHSQTSRPTFSLHCPITEACLSYFWNNRFKCVKREYTGAKLIQLQTA